MQYQSMHHDHVYHKPSRLFTFGFNGNINSKDGVAKSMLMTSVQKMTTFPDAAGGLCRDQCARSCFSHRACVYIALFTWISHDARQTYILTRMGKESDCLFKLASKSLYIVTQNTPFGPDKHCGIWELYHVIIISYSQWRPQTMLSGISSGQTPAPPSRMFLHWCQLQRLEPFEKSPPQI